MSLFLGKTSFQAGKILKDKAITNTKCRVFCNMTHTPRSALTTRQNPKNFDKNDLGLFYTIPNSVSLEVLFKGIFLKDFYEECRTFGETPFLIRKPAMEIIKYMKEADYTAPVNKYLIYGKHGNGKSMTLYNVMHFAYLSKWLIVQVPTILNWVNARKRESTEAEGFIDLPAVGAEWLINFKNQNQALIKELKLELQNDYKWNNKEQNLKGESLLSIVDYGITRTKYSCKVVNSILSEVKALSTSEKVKTLVAIDAFDVIFQPITKIKNKEKRLVAPEEISCITGFKNLAKSDWHNGAVVLTIDTTKNSNNIDDHLPLKQLGRKGFEFLNPFIPIEVPPLTDYEINSVLTYYKTKKWLLNNDGDNELKYISGGNHLVLRRLCSCA